MKVRLIEGWNRAWRFGSVQWATVLAILAGLEPELPRLAAFLPDRWAMWLAIVVIVARLVLVQIRKPEPVKAGGTA